MTTEERIVRFDTDLQVEAYRFNGIMQKFPNHFHEYYVIGFIEQGQRRLSCKNNDYVINTGDLVFFNPFDNHACEQIDHKTLDYRCLNIMPDIMKKVTEDITGVAYLPLFKSPVAQNSVHTMLLHQLHQMILNESSDFHKIEAFYFLMKQLIEAYSKVPTEKNEEKDDTHIQFVCQYIEAHYKEKISLDDLAKIARANKYSLVRSFTRLKGISPYRYLQTTRINAAKKRLEQGMPPLDAALESGFVDQSHFSNFFMDFIGLTPGQYQRIFTHQNH
ncbi:AraC family ligand binding domain-containing protein [Lysinibacillus sp. LZ02]|uniref:AraC family ligand binding domain-containing protein n=1 Tax=Lysinibacillus sp. LZ02 TaxID=3420668 RepID=UPI003D364FD2